jgi:hypothetical protein
MVYRKKRCPFLETKKENWRICYDACCIVGSIDFKIKAGGFSVKHGCFHETYKNCPFFLEGVQKGLLDFVQRWRAARARENQRKL